MERRDSHSDVSADAALPFPGGCSSFRPQQQVPGAPPSTLLLPLCPPTPCPTSSFLWPWQGFPPLFLSKPKKSPTLTSFAIHPFTLFLPKSLTNAVHGTRSHAHPCSILLANLQQNLPSCGLSDGSSPMAASSPQPRLHKGQEHSPSADHPTHSPWSRGWSLSHPLWDKGFEPKQMHGMAKMLGTTKWGPHAGASVSWMQRAQQKGTMVQNGWEIGLQPSGAK